MKSFPQWNHATARQHLEENQNVTKMYEDFYPGIYIQHIIQFRLSPTTQKMLVSTASGTSIEMPVTKKSMKAHQNRKT